MVHALVHPIRTHRRPQSLWDVINTTRPLVPPRSVIICVVSTCLSPLMPLDVSLLLVRYDLECTGLVKLNYSTTAERILRYLCTSGPTHGRVRHTSGTPSKAQSFNADVVRVLHEVQVTRHQASHERWQHRCEQYLSILYSLGLRRVRW